jgi:hypothetical protein
MMIRDPRSSNRLASARGPDFGARPPAITLKWWCFAIPKQRGEAGDVFLVQKRPKKPDQIVEVREQQREKKIETLEGDNYHTQPAGASPVVTSVRSQE